MSKSEEWQESRFTREAFDPAQLREGANSTGAIGGCRVAGFGILTPTTFALAPHGSSPSKAGLRRRARSFSRQLNETTPPLMREFLTSRLDPTGPLANRT